MNRLSRGRIAPAILTIALLMSLLLTGCKSRNNSSEYRFISPDGWAYNDTLSFHPEFADSVVTGALTLSLRHTNDYLYSNLYVEVTVGDSLGVRRDTFEIHLADEFGRWYGRGIGTDFQLSDTIFPSIKLHKPVKVDVRHIMRVDLLPDIEQIGIFLTQQ